MAYIKKLKSGNFQAQIRLKGLRPITKTFSTKTKATAFARQVEGDSELARKLGTPVDDALVRSTRTGAVRYCLYSCVISANSGRFIAIRCAGAGFWPPRRSVQELSARQLSWQDQGCPNSH